MLFLCFFNSRYVLRWWTQYSKFDSNCTNISRNPKELISQKLHNRIQKAHIWVKFVKQMPNNERIPSASPVLHNYSTHQSFTPNSRFCRPLTPADLVKKKKKNLTFLLGHFHSSKWGSNVPQQHWTLQLFYFFSFQALCRLGMSYLYLLLYIVSVNLNYIHKCLYITVSLYDCSEDDDKMYSMLWLGHYFYLLASSTFSSPRATITMLNSNKITNLPKFF